MPTIESTFQTGEPLLSELLEQVHKGLLQLPDFQRPWVWDDDHIRSLLASVSLSYPIGAVMLLQTGGEGVRFQPRPVEGVKKEGIREPERLILDGQQRLTSLYCVLRSGQPVKTRTDKKVEIDRVYYLDMARCLDPEADRLDAVLSVPPERVIRGRFGRQVELDVSSPDKEYELGYFPLEALYDSPRYSVWRRGYSNKFRHDDARLDLFDNFESQVVHRFHKYKIPIIELLKGTDKEAVCQVFEKVNTGGVSLTVFELVTATFAADDFRLPQDWERRRVHLHNHPNLRGITATDYLTAVTLLASYRKFLAGGRAVSCRRKDILNLTLKEYQESANDVELGFLRASKLLVREKIFDDRNLPYQTQLIPLAGICGALGDRFENEVVKQKLTRWYWCGVFGELYGGANESRFSSDIQDVLAWIKGGEEPKTVKDANFTPNRLLTLQSRQSAAYKGIMARLIRTGSRDFINGDSFDLHQFFQQQVDIHHIFPRDYCKKKGHHKNLWNSVINKAPLSAKTNRTIGGQAPSKYLSAIETKAKLKPSDLNDILKTHLVEPSFLRKDNFEAFVRDRASKLLDMIAEAMGKAVSGRDSAEVVKAFGASLAAAPKQEKQIPPPPVSDSWAESLELLEEEWRPLAQGLKEKGIPAPDGVDQELLVRGLVSDDRAVMFWQKGGKMVALVEEGVRPEGFEGHLLEVEQATPASALAMEILKQLKGNT